MTRQKVNSALWNSDLIRTLRLLASFIISYKMTITVTMSGTTRPTSLTTCKTSDNFFHEWKKTLDK